LFNAIFIKSLFSSQVKHKINNSQATKVPFPTFSSKNYNARIVFCKFVSSFKQNNGESCLIFIHHSYFSIRNKINVYSRLVLFPLYFTKFSLNTVSIRVKFGSFKEKITARRMYIYFIPDTYRSSLIKHE